jgi:hypothetical protein
VTVNSVTLEKPLTHDQIRANMLKRLEELNQLQKLHREAMILEVVTELDQEKKKRVFRARISFLWSDIILMQLEETHFGESQAAAILRKRIDAAKPAQRENETALGYRQRMILQGLKDKSVIFTAEELEQIVKDCRACKLIL